MTGDDRAFETSKPTSQRHTPFRNIPPNPFHTISSTVNQTFKYMWGRGIIIQTTTSCIAKKSKPAKATTPKSYNHGASCTICRNLDASDRALGSTAAQSAPQQLFTASVTLRRGPHGSLKPQCAQACEVCSPLEFH